MEFYTLKIANVERQYPLVSLSPKIRIASFNILGDKELAQKAAFELCKKLNGLKFDYLVGPEVTVLPLIHEMAEILGMKRYVILRKQIHGYMIKPIYLNNKHKLVINGADAELIKNKRVVIIDDVVSTGKTIKAILELVEKLNAEVVAKIAILKQGDIFGEEIKDLIYLEKIPLFKTGS